MTSRLVMYTRRQCSLCDDMLTQAQPIAARYGWSIESVDIDSDPALRARHNARIPVLLVDGREVCHHFLDSDALERALAGA